MFTKTLLPDTVRAIKLISGIPIVKNAYLAGGTALAMHLGHRISVDLDFFTQETLEEQILLANLHKLPDAVWVSSGNYDKIAAVEAVKKSIPVMGIINTNSNPTLFNYPIPANDTALGSVGFILNSVKNALEPCAKKACA